MPKKEENPRTDSSCSAALGLVGISVVGGRTIKSEYGVNDFPEAIS